MTRWFESWWVPGGVLVALLAGYAFLPLGETALKLLYDLTAVLAMATAFCGLRVHRAAHVRGWQLVLTGFSGWVVGDLIWLVESWFGSPFPAPPRP